MSEEENKIYKLSKSIKTGTIDCQNEEKISIEAPSIEEVKDLYKFARE